mmetsp:Transcript_29124/g.68147  ORF Transcript_29124/g.68147 Transcript_29124/m.68147 type:complete len:872 (+) Transcript_29124:753-3368(+)|eukprot:CAMPEP_0119376552 /NCGR_PEP_ID=MMETSP1334-20130426/40140_1 /TAXON_ID=127549 /ORGANISM="Calcidiscus leptoporus, Strain RCC1130" /LENGTH=871 /DNA_ID=CAMNT_0007395125 /DNA_START=727 /DNA_END=3342 /DNA_ORIENTATION=+
MFEILGRLARHLKVAEELEPEEAWAARAREARGPARLHLLQVGHPDHDEEQERDPVHRPDRPRREELEERRLGDFSGEVRVGAADVTPEERLVDSVYIAHLIWELANLGGVDPLEEPPARRNPNQDIRVQQLAHREILGGTAPATVTYVAVVNRLEDWPEEADQYGNLAPEGERCPVRNSHPPQEVAVIGKEDAPVALQGATQDIGHNREGKGLHEDGSPRPEGRREEDGKGGDAAGVELAREIDLLVGVDGDVDHADDDRQDDGVTGGNDRRRVVPPTVVARDEGAYVEEDGNADEDNERDEKRGRRALFEEALGQDGDLGAHPNCLALRKRREVLRNGRVALVPLGAGRERRRPAHRLPPLEEHPWALVGVARSVRLEAAAHVDHPVGGVGHRRLREASLGQVRDDVLTTAAVDLLAAVPKEEEVGEGVEDLLARLVDDRDDGEAGLAKLVEAAREGDGRGAVEPRGGLVHEEDRRHRRELHANVDALALAAGDAALLDRSDEVVPHLVKPENIDAVVDVLLARGLRGGIGQPELGIVVQILRHGQIPTHNVVLRHEADLVGGRVGDAVDAVRAGHRAVGGAVGDGTHEGGLAAAGCAHQRDERGGRKMAVDVVKELRVLAIFEVETDVLELDRDRLGVALEVLAKADGRPVDILFERLELRLLEALALAEARENARDYQEHDEEGGEDDTDDRRECLAVANVAPGAIVRLGHLLRAELAIIALRQDVANVAGLVEWAVVASLARDQRLAFGDIPAKPADVVIGQSLIVVVCFKPNVYAFVGEVDLVHACADRDLKVLEEGVIGAAVGRRVEHFIVVLRVGARRCRVRHRGRSCSCPLAGVPLEDGETVVVDASAAPANRSRARRWRGT